MQGQSGIDGLLVAPPMQSVRRMPQDSTVLRAAAAGGGLVKTIVAHRL